jgi:hypothetical protein
MRVKKQFRVAIPQSATITPLRDRHGMSMVPLGKTTFLILLLIAGIVIFLNFRGEDVKAFFSKSPGELGGEWAGTATVTRFQKNTFADAQSMNKRAAVYLNLHIYDRFQRRFKGTGEIMIEGESTPHRFQVTDLSANADHSTHVTGGIMGNQELSEDIDGVIDNGSLRLRFKSDATVPGYDFTVTVRRGAFADFTKLKNELPGAAGHSTGAGME